MSKPTTIYDVLQWFKEATLLDILRLLDLLKVELGIHATITTFTEEQKSPENDSKI